MMAEGTFELHPGDALYPETVLELSDVPQTLYVRGNPEVLSTPALSIIGARKASPYGLAVAELAAKVAVDAGVTVVSGGAVGCDQASGWAAVNAGGKHSRCWGRAPTWSTRVRARGLLLARLIRAARSCRSLRGAWVRASSPFRAAIA